MLSKFEEVIICSLCQEMTSNYIIQTFKTNILIYHGREILKYL